MINHNISLFSLYYAQTHELAGPHLYVIARVGNPVSDLNLGPPAPEKNALPLDQQLSFC